MKNPSRRPFRGPAWALPAALLAALLAGVSLAACSTTEGSAYSSSVGGDEAAARAAAARKAEKQAQAPAPSPEPAQPGGSAIVVFAPPPPPTGSLSVRGLPPGANLYVDGSLVFGSSAELPQGEHYVSASAFGYEDWSASVYVYPFGSVELEAFLPPAAFGLFGAEALPSSFDPGEPGGFGRAALSFQARARGEASLLVLDSGGAEVARLGPKALERSSERFVWDGRDSSGRPVPSGSYLLRVAGRGVDGTEAFAEAPVLVAPSSEVGRFSSLHGGFSGALYAPDARLLADGRFQAAFGGYAVFEPVGGSIAARMPLFAGARAGGLFNDSAELVLSGLVVPYAGYPGPLSWASLAASMKFALLRGPTAAALLLSGSYASFLDESIAGYPPGWDGPARFPGLGAGLVLERREGGVRAFGSAELRASTYYPDWGDGTWTTPGLFAWAYLRGGVEALMPGAFSGDLAVAFSAAARSEPFFGSELDFRPPLSLGLELHWYAPEGGRVLSLYGSGEWVGFNSWYFGGGVGFGFAL
ncbi:MAG TPA: FlgD immunoglobulin-like domain containing protein [Spirochaetia bacterium]|nr:FlgD immunoglobulin-like domain containing protein [Spirochaetia bacterium]